MKSSQPGICACACAIICFPFGIYWAGSRLVSNAKGWMSWQRRKQEYRKHDFLDLTKKSRKRALTLPLECPSQRLRLVIRRQKTNEQLNSMLFAKLPAEMRMMIWERVLGGNEIVIEQWSPRSAMQKRPEHWWALARTCRRAYSECIDLIYSSTHFNIICDFRGTDTVSKLRTSVLSHRWAQIRHLHIRFDFIPIYRSSHRGCVISLHWTGEVDGSKQWPELCKSLAETSRLHHLRINVTDERHWLTAERMDTLANVSVEGVFEIVVHRDLYDDEKELMERGRPFRIITAQEVEQRDALEELHRISSQMVS